MTLDYGGFLSSLAISNYRLENDKRVRYKFPRCKDKCSLSSKRVERVEEIADFRQTR